MRSNSSNSSPFQKIATDPANCDLSDYPEIKILNTTSMAWTNLRCAPSSVQAALEFAELHELQDANDPGANVRSVVEPGSPD